VHGWAVKIGTCEGGRDINVGMLCLSFVINLCCLCATCVCCFFVSFYFVTRMRIMQQSRSRVSVIRGKWITSL
jgi:hypothetical protein